jgi:hypothetical protein
VHVVGGLAEWPAERGPGLVLGGSLHYHSARITRMHPASWSRTLPSVDIRASAFPSPISPRGVHTSRPDVILHSAAVDGGGAGDNRVRQTPRAASMRLDLRRDRPPHRHTASPPYRTSPVVAQSVLDPHYIRCAVGSRALLVRSARSSLVFLFEPSAVVQLLAYHTIPGRRSLSTAEPRRSSLAVHPNARSSALHAPPNSFPPDSPWQS